MINGWMDWLMDRWMTGEMDGLMDWGSMLLCTHHHGMYYYDYLNHLCGKKSQQHPTIPPSLLPYPPFSLLLDTSIDKRRMNQCSRPKLTIETSSDSKPSPERIRCIIVSDTLLYESCYQVGVKAYRYAPYMPSTGDDSISPTIISFISIHYEWQILLLTIPQILL